MFQPHRAPATWTILIGLAIVFAIEWIFGAVPRGFGFEPPRYGDLVLVRMGAIVPNMLADGDYRRLIVAMFLHGNFLHWLTNSIALLQLGALYETLFGAARFIGIFFTTGLIASIASAYFQEAISVGASGAVFGILGAFIFSVLRSPRYRHQPWTRSLVRQLVFWMAVNLIIGYSFPFIDNVAHIGGMVSGLLLGFIPHRVPPPPPANVVLDVPLRDA
jgi:rhomboid protease GluP